MRRPVGRTPAVLSWRDLQGFGLDDDGTYQIAVRVTSDVGYDVGVATVVIANTQPSVSISAPDTIAELATCTLAFSTSGPGDDTVQRFIVHWGDGDSDIAGIGSVQQP